MLWPLYHLYIQNLQQESEVDQIWFADDSAAGGDANRLRRWWNVIVQRGPAFGYYVNPSKTYLVVRQNGYEEAVKVFEDTGVHITTNGKRYLGSTIGTSSFKEEYAQIKMDEWKKKLQNLVEVAATQPQAVYTQLLL
jgi:hypothetical protein